MRYSGGADSISDFPAEHSTGALKGVLAGVSDGNKHLASPEQAALIMVAPETHRSPEELIALIVRKRVRKNTTLLKRCPRLTQGLRPRRSAAT